MWVAYVYGIYNDKPTASHGRSNIDVSLGYECIYMFMFFDCLGNGNHFSSGKETGKSSFKWCVQKVQDLQTFACQMWQLLPSSHTIILLLSAQLYICCVWRRNIFKFFNASFSYLLQLHVINATVSIWHIYKFFWTKFNFLSVYANEVIKECWLNTTGKQGFPYMDSIAVVDSITPFSCLFISSDDKLVCLFADPDHQGAWPNPVHFHKMMSSVVKRLFRIPSSARIVSFYTLLFRWFEF